MCRYRSEADCCGLLPCWQLPTANDSGRVTSPAVWYDTQYKKDQMHIVPGSMWLLKSHFRVTSSDFSRITSSWCQWKVTFVTGNLEETWSICVSGYQPTCLMDTESLLTLSLALPGRWHWAAASVTSSINQGKWRGNYVQLFNIIWKSIFFLQLFVISCWKLSLNFIWFFRLLVISIIPNWCLMMSCILVVIVE